MAGGGVMASGATAPNRANRNSQPPSNRNRASAALEPASLNRLCRLVSENSGPTTQGSGSKPLFTPGRVQPPKYSHSPVSKAYQSKDSNALSAISASNPSRSAADIEVGALNGFGNSPLCHNYKGAEGETSRSLPPRDFGAFVTPCELSNPRHKYRLAFLFPVQHN